MNGRARWMILGLVLLPLPLAGCGARGEKTASASQAPRAVPVTLAKVEKRPLERTVDVVGTLKGWDEVTVGAKKVGRVLTVRHDIGDRVQPGEVLVELEATDADLAIEQAEKQLIAELAKVGILVDRIPEKVPTAEEVNIARLPSVVQAQVALDRARLNLARERNLNSKGAGMRQELQNAESDVRNAEAGLENAVLTARATIASAFAFKVGLDVVRQGRKDMLIRAPQPSQPPFGMKASPTYAVSKRSVSEGQMVREGDAAFDLLIEDPLRLWVNVPERFVAEVAVGQEVRLLVAAYGDRAFAGKVSRINPSIDTTSRTFQVEVAVPNADRKLRPGGFAKASIITQRSDQATIVPLDAIVRFAGVTKLFTVVDGQKAHAIEVETGKEGPGWAEILQPLPDGAQVVTSGQSQLAEGTAVVVRVPEETAKSAPPANPAQDPKLEVAKP
jgi:multidrug efflux pump subunit AcrA (membrane-fusion protein)